MSHAIQHLARSGPSFGSEGTPTKPQTMDCISYDMLTTAKFGNKTVHGYTVSKCLKSQLLEPTDEQVCTLTKSMEMNLMNHSQLQANVHAKSWQEPNRQGYGCQVDIEKKLSQLYSQQHMAALARHPSGDAILQLHAENPVSTLPKWARRRNA